jgi:hypothetical protein
MRNEVTSTWTIQYRNVVTIHNIIRPKGHSFHQKIWRCRKKSQLKANIFAENGLFNEYFLVKTTTKSQPTQPNQPKQPYLLSTMVHILDENNQPNPNSHIYCQQWCLSCLIQPTKRPLSWIEVLIISISTLLSRSVFHIYISSTKQQQLSFNKCGENRNHVKFKIHIQMIQL